MERGLSRPRPHSLLSLMMIDEYPPGVRRHTRPGVPDSPKALPEKSASWSTQLPWAEARTRNSSTLPPPAFRVFLIQISACCRPAVVGCLDSSGGISPLSNCSNTFFQTDKSVAALESVDNLCNVTSPFDFFSPWQRIQCVSRNERTNVPSATASEALAKPN